jgi:MFS transporter, DHA1 family, inner membrane transport protein
MQLDLMIASLKGLGAWLESTFTGRISDAVRHNMHIELWAALAYGAFYATTLPFVPVVLRRTGASPEMIAFYTSQQFVGSVLTAFSIVLMRRRRTMNIITVSWLIGRSLFLFFAFIVNPVWMLVLGTAFWLLEAFPNPGYTRIIQKIYPAEVRGKVMSLVRVGRISTVVLITPLAGWALDHVGYQVLFPIGALLGIGATLFFTRLDVNEGPLPARQTRTLPELWRILREDKRFAAYLRSFAFYGTGTLMSWTVYPLVQVDRLGLSYSELGLLGLAQSLFWLLGYIYWGRVVDRRGGLYVLRMNCALAMLAPFAYIWATNAWMLLPAFITQGIINAGWDMGLINAGIQLADPERVTEYAAVQGTVVGVRGMIVPYVGVGLYGLGVPLTGIFLLSMGLMAIAWVMFGRVDAPTLAQPDTITRYRWPIRFRFPWL